MTESTTVGTAVLAHGPWRLVGTRPAEMSGRELGSPNWVNVPRSETHT
jgi:hypothetical protein